MKNEELIKQAQDKIKELESIIEYMKKGKECKKTWIPDDLERYYFIDGQNKVIEEYYSEININDENRIKAHNCFKTKEEAERKAFEKQLQSNLEAFALEHNECEIDWNNTKNKYCIRYNAIDNKILADWTILKTFGVVYFTSRGIAQKAIDTFKDDFIRYYTINK